MKWLLLLILLATMSCGDEKDEVVDSYQEHTRKYKDFNLKVEIKPADRYGYFLVHIISDDSRYPFGEGINRSQHDAIASALRDLADAIEDYSNQEEESKE